MQTSLPELFSSAAKTRVLEILAPQTLPLSARQIETLSELPIRSVVLALEALEKAKVVKKKRKQARVIFSLNETHPTYELVRSIFMLVEAKFLENRSPDYAKAARSILPFQTSAQRLIKHGKTNLHDQR